jgi:hypothetical protein
VLPEKILAVFSLQADSRDIVSDERGLICAQLAVKKLDTKENDKKKVQST